MLWFDGSIPDAINSAKQQSLVFVVVIIGEDEQSAQLISSWENDEVSEIAHSCCVAIKVDAKSETCLQFSQIYPVVCIPSSFFIGENGIPLEVIAGSVSAEELMKRINSVTQLNSASFPVDSSLSGNPTTVSAPPPASPATRSTTVATEPTAVPETASALSSTVAAVNHGSSDDAGECTPIKENLDSTVERLTKKLEEKRDQRKRGEEENDTKKEMERRKMGKDMQDFKRKQEEDKTKRLLEERNREKAEEKAARERVKQLIAMDRADKAARYSKIQEEKAAKEALLQARQAEQEAKKEALVRERSNVARIQFRLPDGSFLTTQFSSKSTLHEAQHFAVKEVGNRYGNFSLATMFPRREFTSEDLNKTLVELELAPSASIVLLPQSGRPTNTAVSYLRGGFWTIVGTLLYPLLAVWRFLSSFLFAAPTHTEAPFRGPAQLSSSYSSSSSSSDKSKREPLSKKTLEKRPEDFKKEGKICRLRTQEDSEDDNNTWNGNSTQQM
ncbi:UBX domain-containing protein 4 isoform X2 [Channa argus]|uniref:UBX domain-containing protein 4 isoform X2 n=1 Tax=Channa argus TaxID=215402 RepID=UPI003522616A